MQAEISCDFETRSTVELKKSGVYPYAENPNTDVICFSFHVPEQNQILLWTPIDAIEDSPVHQLLCHLADDDSRIFRAWNAQFERLIWREIMVKRYGLPEIKLERWRCTAAEAAACAMPRSLDRCAAVLRVVEQKDKQGHNLMLRLSKPRKVMPDGSIVWWLDAERLDRLYTYNKQDVRTEMAVKEKIRDLTPFELGVYHLDQRINDRGVMLDHELASAVQLMADRIAYRADTELQQISDGAIPAVTNPRAIISFLNSLDVGTDTINKEAVRVLLSADNLPEAARRVLEIRAEAGKSSIKKIAAMFACVCADMRMRGLLLYHGANTGRWAGRLIQPQNLPARSRALGDDFHVADWFDLVRNGDLDVIDLSYPALEVLAMMLRPCLRAAPGHIFYGADFAAIEARVLAWLAGEHWLLKAFAEGQDVYKIMASKIYHIAVDEIGKGAMRDMGKRVILGCGFGMGWNKFILTCAKEDVFVADKEAKLIIDTYRESVPAIMDFHKELERCALAAVKQPGANFYAAHGKLCFTKRGEFLWIILPSKRPLAYYRPKVVMRKTPWGTEQEAVSFECENDKRQWVRVDAYGGLWAENVTQAVARDFMVAAMIRLEDAGYSTLLTIHDEDLAEVPLGFGSLSEFTSLMSQSPSWGTGCPIKVEGWTGPCFRK